MEIKNCPFCGGEAEIKHIDHVRVLGSYVKCKDCGAETKSVEICSKYSSDEEAIKRWNKRADKKARDPDNYKKVSYDGIYFCHDGKTPTDMLKERDPDENYIGTELEALDAYERQLKRWGIIVRGVDARVTILKFKQNEETEKLFPEFIRRSLGCSIPELCQFFLKVTG